MIHLVFFISMCFIDQKKTYDFNLNSHYGETQVDTTLHTTSD